MPTKQKHEMQLLTVWQIVSHTPRRRAVTDTQLYPIAERELALDEMATTWES